MNYNKRFTQLMKAKDYNELNYELANNSSYIREGKIKVTKKIAKKLTIPTIIRMGFENTEALKHIPSSNNLNDMLVDLMLDFKLDREYPKPNAKQLDVIYRTFRCLHRSQYFPYVCTTLNYTKDDIKKMYKELSVSTWMDLFNLVSKKQQPSDDEMRKLFKGKATKAIWCLRNINEKECQQLIEVGYSQYQIDDVMTKDPKRFDDRDVLRNVLRQIASQHSFHCWRAPDYYSCCKYLIQKKESPFDMGSICNHLLKDVYWFKDKVAIKDEKLDTILSLCSGQSSERMIEAIKKYYKMN